MVSPANHNLRMAISYSTTGNNLRLIIHTRFTQIPFHYDEFISVQFIYSGSMTVRFPDHEITLTKRQLMLMNANVVHAFSMDTENDIIFSIQIEREYMKKELLYGISGSGSINDFLLKSLLGEKTDFTYKILDFQDDEQMYSVFEQLFCEYLEPSLCGNALVENYMRIFFILLIRSSSDHLSDSSDNTILSMLAFIEEHSHHCTLQDLAERFNFNAKYISALLKEKTGKTFSDLLTRARLKTICYLLENTDKSIQEISEMCGYTNQTFFYQKFFEVYHMSPKNYRISKNAKYLQ